MAVKQASVDLPVWAPDWLASGAWNYVPLVLVSAAFILFMTSHFRRRQAPAQPPTTRSPSVTPMLVGAGTTSNAELLRRAAGGKPEPVQPGGNPNATLKRVLRWIADSVWAEQHDKITREIVERELIDKLHMARLSAFGRRSPTSIIEPIGYKQWAAYVVDADAGTALVPGNRPDYYDLQFDFDHVTHIWPHKRSWMAG